MKKLTAIFLLTIFFFSSNGYWILSQVNYLQMKEKVEQMKREEADDHNLQQLSFTDKEFSNLNFHDGGNELEFAGKMYDIVKIKKVTGKNFIWCLTDSKETQLKMLAKKQQQEKNLRFKNLLAEVFLPCKNFTLFSGHPNNKKKYSVAIPPDQICTISYDILKPPPQAA